MKRPMGPVPMPTIWHDAGDGPAPRWEDDDDKPERIPGKRDAGKRGDESGFARGDGGNAPPDSHGHRPSIGRGGGPWGDGLLLREELVGHPRGRPGRHDRHNPD